MDSRCSICPSTHRLVCGTGSFNARTLLVGERPGKFEDRVGRPFIGDSGKELDNLYLPLAGLDRDDVFIDNCVRCADDRNKKPTDKEIEGCSRHHLPGLLESINPHTVILMGSTACSLVDGLDLDVQHGIPFKGELFNWSGWIVGIYHPAAGMHQTSLMVPLIDDWKRIGAWLKHSVEHGSRVRKTTFKLIDNDDDLASLVPFTSVPYIGIDTESHAGVDYSIQFSFEVGTGGMILMDNQKMLKELGKLLWSFLNKKKDKGQSYGPECKALVLHNAPADLALAERVVGHSLDGKYIDTMQCSYHIQNLPQGLKALAYRLLGQRRKSWDEVVGPPSKDKLREWLLESIAKAESMREVIPQFSTKTGKPIKSIVQKTPWERKLNGVLMHMSKGADYNPWDRLDSGMEEVFGAYPRKGIKWVGRKEQIDYACQDSSDCLELALLFDTMRREIVQPGGEWDVDESDWDDLVVEEMYYA